MTEPYTPDQFHTFIDFIHRHKGDAPEASEGEK